ncbi:hypothetical protein GIB67_013639 [Kingdonia uniflora]|uniref:Uncharacterized protein n=1 Tax=Kingdonia uniflora TaxID=39325 RepID=A0A7J7NPV0_9MAGN|nr:hypothetical protein GIB67_013639 [Kingdonia uniflora]
MDILVSDPRGSPLKRHSSSIRSSSPSSPTIRRRPRHLLPRYISLRRDRRIDRFRNLQKAGLRPNSINSSHCRSMGNCLSAVFPLLHAVNAVASGLVKVFQKLSNSLLSASMVESGNNAEKVVGVSDVVSHLALFLTLLDPALIFELGINMLYLADVPGGKPEWASASITVILTLLDRQKFLSARESIVTAVVTNLHLLDLHRQVSLFKKRLLLMVRNLRAESDRVRINDDLHSITSKSLFREELVASLVESCFQLSLPLPEQKNSGIESRVIGALAYGTGYGALNWT